MDGTGMLEEIDRLWARGIKVPVSTVEDLDRLDNDEIVAGYLAFRPDDPEPGHNHSRAYWHGWCNRARDHGHLPTTSASMALAKACVARGDFAKLFGLPFPSAAGRSTP